MVKENGQQAPLQNEPRPLGGLVEAKPDFDLAIEAAVLTDMERSKRGLGTSRDWPSHEIQHLK